jgi:transposase
MRTVEDYEGIRRAYFVDKLSIRAIHRMLGYDRETIRKAIVQAAPMPYTVKKPRDAPVIGPYKPRIIELLKESKKQKRKQRFPAHRIFEILRGQGNTGSEGAVHNFVSQVRRRMPTPQTTLTTRKKPWNSNRMGCRAYAGLGAD